MKIRPHSELEPTEDFFPEESTFGGKGRAPAAVQAVDGRILLLPVPADL